MAEFIGDLERFAAELYPYRWPIAAVILAMLTGFSLLAYRMGWHAAVLRHRRALAVVGVPALALFAFAGWQLGSPLVTNTTVEEDLPLAFSAVVPSDMTRAEVEQIMMGMAKINQEVNEGMPQGVMKGMSVNSEIDGVPMEAAKLKEGSFRDADSFHRGSGQATIYRGPDGSRLLRLENFNVTNGPDLHVILTPHANPTSQSDVKAPGYVDLGKLKGNRGNQNYLIPDSVDISSIESVVIYCQPFHVVFSVASL